MPAIDDLMEQLANNVEPAEIVELANISVEDLVELLRSHLIDNAAEVQEFLND
jgi:hypothetical protein